jgi:hypothetical protein
MSGREGNNTAIGKLVRSYPPSFFPWYHERRPPVQWTDFLPKVVWAHLFAQIYNEAGPSPPITHQPYPASRAILGAHPRKSFAQFCNYQFYYSITMTYEFRFLQRKWPNPLPKKSTKK